MNFWNTLKKRIPYVLVISLLIAITSFFVPALKATADGPAFNHMSGDAELLRGADGDSKNFTDPVSGLAGDTFTGLIYYHNGTEYESTAENTTIKVSIPHETHLDANTSLNTFNIDASISASNMVGVVTDTIVDGKVVGLSGLATNLDAEANVKFVAGSVKWYPENIGLSAAPVVLPNNQTGDEIISQGINLGTIASCWAHSGFVTFQYQTVKKTDNISLTKSVQNQTNGETAWTKDTSAFPADQVNFKVDIANSGDTILSSVMVKDSLPGDLNYTDGSLSEAIGNGDYQKITDSARIASFFDSGDTINQFLVGDKHSYKFSATVGNTNVAHTVINQATATVGAIVVNDTANVDIKVNPNPATIVKSKTALDVTSGAQGTSFTANPGDTITYTLTTRNTGGQATDVTIADGIADVLDYANVTSVSDNGQMVDGTTGNDTKIIQYPVLTIAPGESVIRTFTVKVVSVLPNTPASGFHFDYIMFNNYGNDVSISLPKPVPGTPILNVDKKVRDFTSSENTFSSSDVAKAGDTLEYRIDFSNTGTATANNIKISDVLPPNVQYLNGTTVYSINNDIERTFSDGITSTNGITFSTLQAGDTGYIKFRVITSTSLAKGETLTNTAFLVFGTTSTSDTAKTVIQETIVPVVPTNTTTPTTSIVTLPKTGATTAGIAFLLSCTVGLAFVYFDTRKKLQSVQI